MSDAQVDRLIKLLDTQTELLVELRDILRGK